MKFLSFCFSYQFSYQEDGSFLKKFGNFKFEIGSAYLSFFAVYAHTPTDASTAEISPSI